MRSPAGLPEYWVLAGFDPDAFEPPPSLQKVAFVELMRREVAVDKGKR
jgi:hypothetical protein